METEIKKLYVYKDKPQHLPTDRGLYPFGRVCHHCCQAPLATVTKGQSLTYPYPLWVLRTFTTERPQSRSIRNISTLKNLECLVYIS